MRTRVRCRFTIAGLSAVLLVLAVSLPPATLGAAQQADSITFTGSVAPIVYEHCVTCHRPGEAAPFSLMAYEDVVRRGALMAEVTRSRYMPPWHAAHEYGEFVGERWLTDEQIATIGAWVSSGMPQGDPARLPELPRFTEGWHLGEPDLILQMPQGFEVPSDGPDVFRNFVLPIGLTEDRWLRAVEFRPTARTAAHHALFMYTDSENLAQLAGRDGQPGFSGSMAISAATQGRSGMLGGWAVGGTPVFYPEGLALPLPAGAQFVLQIHFHPTGKGETEQSQIGLYFADAPPERPAMVLSLPPLAGFGAGINIPPGVRDYTIRDSFTLPADITVYAALAHAHYLGKEMKLEATLPDGSTRPLLWIPDWDFNWQDTYLYKEPIRLPKDTRLDVMLRYDNSSDNPRNPHDPPQRVTWGEESYDEMGAIGLQFTVDREDEEAAFEQADAERNQAAARRGLIAIALRERLVTLGGGGSGNSPSLQIRLIDREGGVIKTVGEPGRYSQAALSPDGSRVAVIRRDPNTNQEDVWVFDIETGAATPLTADEARNTSPVWSSDGRRIMYVTESTDDGSLSVLASRPSDGTGAEEIVYKNPGAPLVLNDWSGDFLSFWSQNSTVILQLPEPGQPARQVTSFAGRGARFSPDRRFLAYSSNESGQWATYVRVLAPDGDDRDADPVRISDVNAVGGIFWRSDGRELIYLVTQPPQRLLTTAVSLTNDFDFEPSTPLFELPAPLRAPAQLSSIADGNAERFVLLVAVPEANGR